MNYGKTLLQIWSHGFFKNSKCIDGLIQLQRERAGGLMKLYHAGKKEIRVPDIYRGRKNADFGQGFYLTPDREFAYRWAYEGYVVNEYELDMTGLDVIRFSREADWFGYIFRNRRAEDTLAADVVTGPVANDTLYNTFGIISSGLLKPADALALLCIGPEFTQTAVKSLKALQNLTWTGAQRITDAGRYRELVKKEEAEYQKLFAEYMSKVM